MAYLSGKIRNLAPVQGQTNLQTLRDLPLPFLLRSQSILSLTQRAVNTHQAMHHIYHWQAI